MTTPFASASFPSNPTVPASAPAGYTTPTTPPSPDVSPPIDAAQLESMRGNILELVLREVAQAILGAFVPGAESAFDQIAAWAQNIPLLGPLVEALTGAIDGGLNELEAWATGIPSTVVDHVALNPGKFFAEAMQVTGITGLWLSIEPFLNKELGWAAVWDDIANFISGILGITNNPTGVATGSITHSAGEALKAAVLPSATAAANAAATGAQAVATIANADPAALTDAVKTAASSAGPLAANVASGLASHPAVKAVTDAVTSALSDGSVPAAASNITSNLLAGPAAAVKSLADAADALAPAKGITGEVFSVAQNVLGLADNPSGSSSGSIVSLIASVLGSGVLSSGDVVSNIASTLTQALTDAAAGSLSQANADITSRFGTTSLGQLLSEILGAFTNPRGSSHGSLLQSIWWSIWSFINCNGLTGRGFTAGNNITGALDNPTGSSLGSLVGYVTDLVQRLFGNGGAFLTELVKTLQDLSSGNILGLISDFFTFGPVLSAVMRDVSAIANFFSSPTQPTWTNTSSGQQSPASAAVSALLGLFGLGSGSGGLAEVFTTFLNDFMGIFGNPNGLGTGSPGLKSPDQIPVVAPTHNLLQEFFGGFAAYLGGGSPGTSTNGPLNGVFQLLEQIPLAGGLFDLVAGVVDQIPIIGTILRLLGIVPSGSGGGVSSVPPLSPDTALSDLLGLLPSNKPVPANVLSALAPSSEKNALAKPNFNMGAGIQGQGLWCWDGWLGETPTGAVRTIRPGKIVIYNIVGTSQGISLFSPITTESGIILEYLRQADKNPDDSVLSFVGYVVDWALTGTDSTYYEWVNVPYPAAEYPMGPSVQSGATWLMNQIKATPGPFVFIMDSQGCQVGAAVYDELRFGSMQDRRSDFLAGIAFGNLRREEGHTFPGFPDPAPGTSGMCPVSLMTTGPYAGSGNPSNPKIGNLIDTEDLWWDFCAPGDYFACTPINGVTVVPPADAVCGNTGDIAGIPGLSLRQFYAFINQSYSGAGSIVENIIAWGAAYGIGGLIGILEDYLGNVMAQINALGGATSPHNMYYKAKPFLSKGDDRTFPEIALDYLAQIAAQAKRDGLIHPAANGIQHQFMREPFVVTEGQVVGAGASVMWVDVTASGAAIEVGVNVYDSAGNLLAEVISDETTISDPEPSSHWNYVPLKADFVMPPGAATARLFVNVAPQAMKTGIVWIDLDSMFFAPTSLVDGALINAETLSKLSGEQVSGPQGIADVATAFQNMFDGFASTAGGSPVQGTSLAKMLQSQGAAANDLAVAYGLGVINHQILSNVSVQPLSNGNQPTGQVSFTLPDGTLPTVSIASGTSLMCFMNTNPSIQVGFVEFMAKCAGTPTGIYLNLYTMDGTTGDLTNVWSSADISSDISTSDFEWVPISIPTADQPSLTLGQLIAWEIVAQGAQITVVAQTTNTPNKAYQVPPNLGASRTTASTGGASPASLTPSQLGYGGARPFVCMSVSDIPPVYWPPNQKAFESPGMSTYALPTAILSGDLIDAVGCGGGGAAGWADGNYCSFLGIPYGTLNLGQGGDPGKWASKTLVYGTDIPTGTTELTTFVGWGGDAPSGSGSKTIVGYGFDSPPQFDSVATGFSGNGTSLSWSHTATAGAYVIVGLNTTYGTFDVKYGDKTMIPLGLTYLNETAGVAALALYGLENAPGGTSTITITTEKAAYFTGNSISFTNVSCAGLVTNAGGSSTDLSQTVECGTNQIVVQAFANQGYGQLSAFSGGTKRYYGYLPNGQYYSVGLSFSHAASSTTFTAKASVSDVWGGLSVVLNPAGTILLSADGGQAGGPGGTDNYNPASMNKTSSGPGPGNTKWSGRLYVGGAPTAAQAFPGNSPGGASSGGDQTTNGSGRDYAGGNGALYLTARQGNSSAGTVGSGGGIGGGSELSVTYEATGTGAHNAVSSTTSDEISWTHTSTGGANCAVILIGAVDYQNGTVNFTCTYGAQQFNYTLTEFNYVSTSNGEAFGMFALGIIGPPSGTQTVTLAVSGATFRQLAGNTISYQNVGSFGNFYTNTGASTAPSVSGVSSSAGQMVVGGFAGGPDAFTSFNQAQRWDQTDVSSIPIVLGDVSGGSTVDFTAATPTSWNWGGLAGVLLPSS